MPRRQERSWPTPSPQRTRRASPGAICRRPREVRRSSHHAFSTAGGSDEAPSRPSMRSKKREARRAPLTRHPPRARPVSPREGLRPGDIEITTTASSSAPEPPRETVGDIVHRRHPRRSCHRGTRDRTRSHRGHHLRCRQRPRRHDVAGASEVAGATDRHTGRRVCWRMSRGGRLPHNPNARDNGDDLANDDLAVSSR